MIQDFVKKVFGTSNDRYIRSLRPLVLAVNDFEPKMQALSNQDLRQLTDTFRARLKDGETLEEIKAEAFAAVREAAVRTLEMRHFDVQIIGGNVLHEGRIAEMKTGEGKTLVATLAAYLNALSGKGVHIVTVNDYLAKRDAEWMGAIYRFLGLSVGVVYSGMDESVKKEAYLADITYGQNNEFGFDFLRDNMKFNADEMMQRGHNYAIVDEVDSILIDEARTPLIISGPAEDATDKYFTANKIVPKLKAEEDYEIDLKTKQPTLTEAGVARAEELLEIENLYDPENIEMLHHVNQALKAHTIFQRDVDYVVRDGQIIIVDEFTGRLMPGRRWSNGQHQAIEAKEKLQIARENQTLASVTFQNYFRMYDKLSGMTGTADTEAAEFAQIYGLPVVVIPTNKPLIRDDQTDMVYRTRPEKYRAAADDIEEIHERGQPVLVGTVSIEQSETLSKILGEKGLTHNVLNAKHHEREAEIVAQAGRFGSITIATNMAGRGTDIMLGGNPEFLAVAEVGNREPEDPEYQEAYRRYQKQCEEEKRKVIEAGGLFILGTERHEARRIDNQLRGRAGRQGDPGTTRFYISLEDDLMKRFAGDKMRSIMQRVGWEEGVALDGRLISRTIENAQRRVEGLHFESRKHVTEYDDVMNKQRMVVYNLRSKILHNEDVQEQIKEALDDLFEELVLEVCDEKKRPVEWDLDRIKERYKFITRQDLEFPGDLELEPQRIFDCVRKPAWELYQQRTETLNQKLKALDDLPVNLRISQDPSKPLDFSTIEQDTFLETLDHLWNQHIQEMEQLREGIGLRGYGQKNPKHEYQREGFMVFQAMLGSMKENVLRRLYYYEVPTPEEFMKHIQEEEERRRKIEKQMQMVHPGAQGVGADGQPAAAEESKDPEEQRKKLEAQKRARRKKKR